MQNEATVWIFQTIVELGSFVRNKRKQIGYTDLERGAKAFSVGKRFLSELERGKKTAEIGKVLDVLHGLGLDLAVIPRKTNSASKKLAEPFTQILALDFPYDWSNPEMSESTLIDKVLEKARFMDVLRLVKHYGLESIEVIAQKFIEAPNSHRLNQILARIRRAQAKVRR